MIYKVQGDILLTKAQAIVHGVGVNDPMDKGLALALRNNYPGLQQEFVRWCYQIHAKPGQACLWKGPNKVHIINLITHENTETNDHHYDKATLNNLRQALTELIKIVRFEKLASIALPKIATGFGDLDWDDVLPIIENTLAALDIPIFVYDFYLPSHQANEPGG